jgi:hypothetical protein
MDTTSEDKKKKAKKKADQRYRLKHAQKIKEKRKLHYLNNKDGIDKKNLDYYYKNLDKVKNLQRRYYDEHSAHLRDRARKYYKENSEKIKKYQKDYRKNNIEKINNRVKKYNKNRYRLNDHYKLKKVIRRRILDALKYKNTKKLFNSEILLGCSIIEARQHIESLFREGMSWENHGPKGWHIDHIKPCASFDLTNPEEQKKCFHYTNLQPLWWWENISKSDKTI